MIHTAPVPPFRIAVGGLTEGVTVHDAVGVVGFDLLAIHRTYRGPGEAPWSVSDVVSGRRALAAATLDAAIEATACMAWLGRDFFELIAWSRDRPDPERPVPDDEIPSHLMPALRAARAIRVAAERAEQAVAS